MKEQQLIQQSEALLSALAEVIDNEQTAIKSANSELLSEIVQHKGQLLDQLSALQGQLLLLLKNAAKNDTKLSVIRDLLQKCQAGNKQSRQLTAQSMNVVDKSMVFLESIMQVGSVRVYGPEGKQDKPRLKRNLGVA